MPDAAPEADAQPPRPTLSGPAAWAEHLLTGCGLPPRPAGLDLASAGGRAGPADPASDPRRRWAASGAMALTGYPDGEPLLPPVDLATAADGAALAFSALSGLISTDAPPPGSNVATRSFRQVTVDGAALLGERAALLGLTRRGAITPGGSTRLLPAADGWVAVGLRRPDDLGLIPALIEAAVADPADPWPELADWMLSRSAAAVVDRAQLLGLPAATRIDDPVTADRPWRLSPLTPLNPRLRSAGSVTPPSATGRPWPWSRRPLVVDLSTLWAGPLATSLLAQAGVDVIKLETPDRPDGTRSGSESFNDLLNAGKLSVAARPDSRLVRALIERADLVVTSARPRALEQLGLAPAPGRSWLTVTGYGWTGARRNWVAYGDDAAVAAGLLAGTAAAPVFCADAVADPLTGLHAAVAALAVLIAGRPVHLDVSLHQVTAHLMARLPRVLDPEDGPDDHRHDLIVLSPHARPSRGAAARLGADQDHPLVRA